LENFKAHAGGTHLGVSLSTCR